MYELMRPWLFALDAERSHVLGLNALAALGGLPGPLQPAPGPSRTVMGILFPNVVGVAAGLDKDAIAVEGLARLGFGHVEVGTVTPRPQPGNPQPRLFRLPEASALINRMGFNNDGADAVAARLQRLKDRGSRLAAPLGVNIGKNKDTPIERAVDDYLACMDALHDSADYFAVNLSSPNTPGLRDLQYGEPLKALLGALKARQAELQSRSGRHVPLCVKLAPDLAEDDAATVAEALIEFEVEGVIAGNTTVTRPQVATVRHADEAGGLSGAPLAPLSRQLVARLRERLQGRVAIIGVGGILSAADAQALLDAGADLVQIYTGLIYRGPSLVRAVARLGRG
ncbi:MAG: quinone-dependent dihydroorotate dehydrogenase [Gammaproteobacteria bacterium]|nr:quinone-dependent dihydroorotate dehydrogenase [Gammaproteobacteria bacterium]